MQLPSSSKLHSWSFASPAAENDDDVDEMPPHVAVVLLRAEPEWVWVVVGTAVVLRPDVPARRVEAREVLHRHVRCFRSLRSAVMSVMTSVT